MPVPQPTARGVPWRALLAVAVAAVAGLGWLIVRAPDPSASTPTAREAPGPAEPRLGSQATMSSAVVQLMVGGNAAVARGGVSDLVQARALFQQATALDERYAPAHAGLAHALVLLADAGAERPSALLPQAVEHGDLAVELDPTGARGWYALARAEVLWTRDWSRAEMHYRRAIALDPTAWEPAYRLAELLAALGRTREALDQSGLALALGPTTPALNTSAGIVHYYTGDHPEGLHRFATALAEGGREADVAVWVARARAALGLSAEAQAIAQKAGGPEARPSWVVGYVHALAGRRTEAERVLAAMGERSTRAYVPALEFAYVWAALGESNKALGFIETAVQERSPGLEWLLVEPLFSKLRAEPRFRAAGAAMKLDSIR